MYSHAVWKAVVTPNDQQEGTSSTTMFKNTLSPSLPLSLKLSTTLSCLHYPEKNDIMVISKRKLTEKK
jgi:hypothetical protein